MKGATADRETRDRLMKAAERWSRQEGCVEIASNTWLHNVGSRRAHQALGFAIVERTVSFRKALRAVRR